MRQSPLKDAESVDSIVSLISSWGDNLHRWRNLRRRPHRVLVEGESFAAELSLVLDREKEDGSLAIGIGLRRRGRGRHRDRYLLVSYGQTSRRMDYSRPWRIAAGKIQKETRRHRRLLDSIHLAREIYWTPDISQADLGAQVVVALVQLGCLPPIPMGCNLLANYIATNFKIRVDNLPHAERKLMREAIAVLASAEVLNHWSFPEDCRAFRKYIKARVRLARREYLDPSDLDRDPHDDAGSLVEDRDEADEPSWDPRRPDSAIWHSALSRSIAPRAILREEMTIASAADYLSRTKSYVYRLIREGRIRTTGEKGAARLSERDVARVSQTLERRIAWKKRRNELERSGKTESAARKAAYRSLGPAPRI
jgi:excisionase family DNA binding protein